MYELNFENTIWKKNLMKWVVWVQDCEMLWYNKSLRDTCLLKYDSFVWLISYRRHIENKYLEKYRDKCVINFLIWILISECVFISLWIKSYFFLNIVHIELNLANECGINSVSHTMISLVSDNQMCLLYIVTLRWYQIIKTIST